MCVQLPADASLKILCRVCSELFLGFQQLCFRAGGQLGPLNAHMLPSDLAGSSQLTRGFCLALSRTHVPHGRQFLQSLTSMHRPLEAVDRYGSRYCRSLFVQPSESTVHVAREASRAAQRSAGPPLPGATDLQSCMVARTADFSKLHTRAFSPVTSCSPRSTVATGCCCKSAHHESSIHCIATSRNDFST